MCKIQCLGSGSGSGSVSVIQIPEYIEHLIPIAGSVQVKDVNVTEMLIVTT